MSDLPISYAMRTLWGASGGQLELVSQRVEMRSRGDDLIPVMVMRFTDHDVQNAKGYYPELIDGQYYELEFPLFEG